MNPAYNPLGTRASGGRYPRPWARRGTTPVPGGHQQAKSQVCPSKYACGRYCQDPHIALMLAVRHTLVMLVVRHTLLVLVVRQHHKHPQVKVARRSWRLQHHKNHGRKLRRGESLHEHHTTI